VKVGRAWRFSAEGLAVRPPTAVVHALALLDSALVHVSSGTRSGSPRAAYARDAGRDAWTRHRDALVVAVLAYAGLRPGELRALRCGDVRTATIVVQRAADPNGDEKPTKTRASRSVRLLAPLAQDLREWRLACGRPADSALVIARRDGSAWTKDDWDSFRADAWRSACKRVGLDPTPRPYDLRHSFASLLLAEGRTVHYVPISHPRHLRSRRTAIPQNAESPAAAGLPVRWRRGESNPQLRLAKAACSR